MLHAVLGALSAVVVTLAPGTSAREVVLPAVVRAAEAPDDVDETPPVERSPWSNPEVLIRAGVALLAAVLALALLRRGVVALRSPPKAQSAPPEEEEEPFLQGNAERKRRDARREALETMRAQTPDDLQTLSDLMLLELKEGRRQAAAPLLERIVTLCLAARDPEEAARWVHDAMPPLTASDLKPAFALYLVKTVTHLSRAAQRQLWLRAAEEPGPSVPFALVCSAELALEDRDLDSAAEALARLDRLGPGQARERAERVRWRLQNSGLSVAAPTRTVERPTMARQRQTFQAAVVSLGKTALTVQGQSGTQKEVPLRDIKCIAAGLVPTPDLRRVVVCFLVLDWGGEGRPALLLRFDSDTGGLPIDRGGDAREAWVAFLRRLLDLTGAWALPDAARLTAGRLPLGGDAHTLEEALFSTLPNS